MNKNDDYLRKIYLQDSLIDDESENEESYEVGIQKINELKKILKRKCKEKKVPYSAIVELIEEDVDLLTSIDFDILRNNYLILYRFDLEKKITLNPGLLLENPRETYAKIMMLKEMDKDISKFDEIDLTEPEMREKYEESLYINNLTPQIMSKFKCVYEIYEKNKQIKKEEKEKKKSR